LLGGVLVLPGLDQPLCGCLDSAAVLCWCGAGSGSGGTRETREMLQFCIDHSITADVEIVGRHDINTALQRLAANDVKYRFVIDMAHS
jgi:D-arabinose 1-dehydrogenase-like Zn-dependent alcohol dehydrogenase